VSNYSIKYVIDAQDKLSPILRKIKDELKALDKIGKDLSKPIKMKIDIKQIREQLKKVKKLAEIKAKVKADMTKFKAELSGITSKPITIRVHLDLSRAKQQLRALQGRLTRIRAGDVIPHTPTNQPMSASARHRDGMSAAAIGGATLAVGVTDAMNMDRAMTSLAKATNGTRPFLKSLKNMAIQMESETGKSAVGFVDMLTDASKAGVAVENLNQSVRDGAMVSAAWDMSVEDTSDALTHIRSGLYSSIPVFKDQQAEVMKTAAAIAYLADKTETSEWFMANYIGRTAGLSTAFGQSQDAVMAAGAAFDAIGVQPEVAARAMNSAAASLGGFVKKLKADAPILKRLGMTRQQAMRATNDDMIRMIFNIAQASDGLEHLEKVGVMTDIFGVGFGDELSRLGTALPIYTRNLVKVGDKTAQASTLQEQYTLDINSTNKAVGKMTEGFKSMIGTAVTPWLDAIGRSGAVVMDFAKQHPIVGQMAVMLSLFAAGAFIASLGLFSLAAIVGVIISPIGLMVLGIMAAILLFQEMWNNSETLRGSFKSLGEILGEVNFGFGGVSMSVNPVTATFRVLGILVGSLVMMFGQLVIWIQTVAMAWTAFVTGNWSAIGDVFGDGLDRMSDRLREFRDRMANDFTNNKLTIEEQYSQDEAGRKAAAMAGLADAKGAGLAGGMTNAGAASAFAVMQQRDAKAAADAKKLADAAAALTKKQEDAATKSMQASDALIKAAGMMGGNSGGEFSMFLGMNR
jgi:TP901 family phage tail tape measure protein